MNWKDHSKEIHEGEHAFLSPSNYHWVNYSDEKLLNVYRNHLAALQGTQIHAFACSCILFRQELPDLKKTLNLYVNDAIGFGMKPEQQLYFSPHCFGTADAISFKKNFLRIHDLKTGETKASLKQLEVYAALFCLDYEKNPKELDGIELRIYQNDDYIVGLPKASIILQHIETIRRFNELIEECEEDDYGL